MMPYGLPTARMNPGYYELESGGVKYGQFADGLIKSAAVMNICVTMQNDETKMLSLIPQQLIRKIFTITTYLKYIVMRKKKFELGGLDHTQH